MTRFIGKMQIIIFQKIHIWKYSCQS